MTIALIWIAFALTFVCIDLEHIEKELHNINLDLAARRKEAGE